jgi:uncharacterized membrane protein YvlD (DUF360 family)
MKRYLIRLALIACAFYFIFPMIHGIQFHGNFVHALLVGAIFAFVGWVVESIAIAISTLLAIGTLGIALIVLVPAWLLGSWLLPAVALKLVADIMPSSLSISGWMPAIWGGLIMLLVGVVTSGNIHKQIIKTSSSSPA